MKTKSKEAQERFEAVVRAVAGEPLWRIDRATCMDIFRAGMKRQRKVTHAKRQKRAALTAALAQQQGTRKEGGLDALTEAEAACRALLSQDSDWDTSYWNQAVERCIHVISSLKG